MFWQTTSGAHGSAGRAEWLLQGKSLSFYQNRLDQRLRSEGAQGASGKPLLAAVYTNLVVKNPAGGLTRRLRRGRWGCRPEGGSTFFRAERKYQRKLAARRLREKGFYCPFCRRGSLCRAHPNWQDFTCHRARSELAFFRRQNGRAFFPPLPIAALLPRSWRWADSNGVAWDVSMQLRRFCSAENRLGYISTFDVKHT